MPSKFKIVKTLDQVKRVIKYCQETKYCSHDFETSGGSFANPLEYPTIIGISFQPGSSYIIPLGHKDSPFKDTFPEILKLLSKELFENPEVVKIAWNMKFEHKWLMRYGCNYVGRCFDGMLAKYVLDEERPNDLKSMVDRFYPEFMGYEDKSRLLASKYGWANIPLKPLSKYCGLDCDLTLRLMVHFENKLIKAGLYNVFRNLLMPASTVLAESEFSGIDIDVKYLDKLIVDYADKIRVNEISLRNHKKLRKFERLNKQEQIQKLITSVKNEIRSLEESDKPNIERLINAREEKISRYIAGEFNTKKEKKLIEPFNFNSPTQLIELFYKSPVGFKFPIIAFTKDKFKRDTTTPSTAEDTLVKLKQFDKAGFIEKLLTHRGLSKLHSTYMVGTRAMVTPDNKVHANFKIHGTVTGRLSCSDPNLQNIPRDCINYNTTIISNKGIFKIGSKVPKSIGSYINTDTTLKVLTDKGNFKPITHWVNKGKKQMFEVTMRDGTTIKCTMGHQLKTLEEGFKSVQYILDNNLTVLKYEDRSIKNTRHSTGE